MSRSHRTSGLFLRDTGAQLFGSLGQGLSYSWLRPFDSHGVNRRFSQRQSGSTEIFILQQTCGTHSPYQVSTRWSCPYGALPKSSTPTGDRPVRVADHRSVLCHTKLISYAQVTVTVTPLSLNGAIPKTATSTSTSSTAVSPIRATRLSTISNGTTPRPRKSPTSSSRMPITITPAA